MVFIFLLAIEDSLSVAIFLLKAATPKLLLEWNYWWMKEEGE